MKFKRTYPVILHPENKGYSVEIPDINKNSGGVWTQGESKKEALEMATDAAKLYLEDEEVWPLPSNNIVVNGEEILGYITLTTSIEKIRKNVSIPKYLAEKGQKENINFSKVLTEALEERLVH